MLGSTGVEGYSIQGSRRLPQPLAGEPRSPAMPRALTLTMQIWLTSCLVPMKYTNKPASQCNLAASSRILRGFIQHSGPLPSSIVSVLYKLQRSVFLSQLMWTLYVSVAKPSGSQHSVNARQLQVDGGCSKFPNSLPESPSGCRIQFRVPQQNPLLRSPTEPVAVNPTYWPCVMLGNGLPRAMHTLCTREVLASLYTGSGAT